MFLDSLEYVAVVHGISVWSISECFLSQKSIPLTQKSHRTAVYPGVAAAVRGGDSHRGSCRREEENAPQPQPALREWRLQLQRGGARHQE